MNRVLTLGAFAALVAAGSQGCANGSDTQDVILGSSSTGFTTSSGAGGSSSTATTDAATTTSSSSGGTAMDYYVANVHDGLVTECSICHSPQGTSPLWMQLDASSSYDEVSNYVSATGGPFMNGPSCSHLLLHTKASHTGPGFSAALEASVAEWLTQEAAERDLSCGGDGPPDETLQACNDALAELQACMTFTDWDLAGMGLVSSQQTAGDGPCLGCHATGTGSFYAAGDSQLTFDAHEDDTFFLQKLITCKFENGKFSTLEASNRIVNKGLEQCAGEPCHPKFIVTTTRKDAITSFVTTTIDAWKAGPCE